MLGTSAVTKISARSGVVHVGIRLVPMLVFARQLSKSKGGNKWAHAKYGFDLNALIPSAPRSTKTQTL